ncbi:MAG TPA: primosomal protein N' [Patescibacteria group bacterium]|nr:primosomal protein N' [Patescibacteria group bacterium]
MKNNESKHIIDVVPLTRIPLTRNQSFFYLCSEKLEAGTLVSIPLFRRKVEGIVLGSKSDFKRLGNIKPKKIEKIIEKKYLTAKQLELSQYISDHYIYPLGIVMKGFVPKRAKSRKSQKIELLKVYRTIELTPEQKDAVKKIVKSRVPLKAKNYLLFGPSGSGKTEVYIHSMMEIRKLDKDAQFLVLVPEQTLTPQAYERYSQCFNPQEIAILSSNTTRGQFYSNWLRVKSGEAKIIIATRIGVMAPFKNLRMVVVDEEQDMSYKSWDMSPRYDARKVAEKIGQLHKCSVVRGSATPSIETYYGALEGKYILIKLPQLSLKNENSRLIIPDSHIELIDMKKEKWQKNYSPISKKLKSEIGYALKNNLQTILLINRQGMSSFSICESCRAVLRCIKCDRALVYDQKGIYRCPHCTFKTSITPQCPKCKGLVFKNIGLGTQKVEREISDLFPSAKIVRIDSQAVLADRKLHQKLYERFSSGEIDVLIGTQMISKGWDFPRVALVGIIDVDNMLSIPDFSTGEKAFDIILQVAGRVSRPGSIFPGTVLIQTYYPESKFLKMAASKNYQEFYSQEIKERKELSLPPFSKIIKLIIQDYNLNTVESSSLAVYNKFKEISSDISISRPQEAYVSKIRGRYRQIVILKTVNQNWPSETVKILKSLGRECTIDVDPINII